MVECWLTEKISTYLICPTPQWLDTSLSEAKVPTDGAHLCLILRLPPNLLFLLLPQGRYLLIPSVDSCFLCYIVEDSQTLWEKPLVEGGSKIRFCRTMQCSLCGSKDLSWLAEFVYHLKIWTSQGHVMDGSSLWNLWRQDSIMSFTSPEDGHWVSLDRLCIGSQICHLAWVRWHCGIAL